MEVEVNGEDSLRCRVQAPLAAVINCACRILNWKLDVLKDGESGFAEWRKSFDLQVNAVWNGIGKLLWKIRGHEYVDVIFDEHVCQSLVTKAKIYPPARSLYWNYKYISIKLYMVVYTHCGIDPIKVLEESSA